MLYHVCYAPKMEWVCSHLFKIVSFVHWIKHAVIDNEFVYFLIKDTYPSWFHVKSTMVCICMSKAEEN